MFSRSINFVQSNDPVTWEGQLGFKEELTEEERRNVADDGKGLKAVLHKGLFTKLRKKNKLVQFYQTPNVFKVGKAWLLWDKHQYTWMQEKLLGKALFN